MRVCSHIALAALRSCSCRERRSRGEKPLVYDVSDRQPQQLPSATALQLRAATTANPTVNEPQGTAPTSPANGDRWTTSAGFYGRAGGVTYGPFNNGTVLSVTCGGPLSGGTITTTGTCTISANALALTYLAQIGGSSYLGNQSTSTGNVTAYAWPSCTNDGAHALVSLPGSVPPIQCIAIGGTSSGANPFYIGTPYVASGIGAPSTLRAGRLGLHMRIGHRRSLPADRVRGRSPDPGAGRLLGRRQLGHHGRHAGRGRLPGRRCARTTPPRLASPRAGRRVTIDAASVFAPSRLVAYKLAASGESTTQTPCSGSNNVVAFEVSGISSWAASYGGQVTNTNGTGGSTLSISTTTTSARIPWSWGPTAPASARREASAA
jgi:hypothetical protein